MLQRELDSALKCCSTDSGSRRCRGVAIARAVGIVYSEICLTLQEALRARPLDGVLATVKDMQEKHMPWREQLRRWLRAKLGMPLPAAGKLDHSPEMMALAGLDRKKVRSVMRPRLRVSGS